MNCPDTYESDSLSVQKQNKITISETRRVFPQGTWEARILFIDKVNFSRKSRNNAGNSISAALSSPVVRIGVLHHFPFIKPTKAFSPSDQVAHRNAPDVYRILQQYFLQGSDPRLPHLYFLIT
jgi:hypothetical protein